MSGDIRVSVLLFFVFLGMQNKIRKTMTLHFQSFLDNVFLWGGGGSDVAEQFICPINHFTPLDDAPNQFLCCSFSNDYFNMNMDSCDVI